ncbi:signal recognition particle protein Srp19, partial [Candidatus Marsarchaeota archaeon]|nr:signal recognition particle protein Srp19 [Candidatus Marsarchaeota archaeon]
KKYKVIIGSMTRDERKDEKLVREQSRIKRIASGSGTSEKDVKELLGDFNKMKRFANMIKNDRNFKKNFSRFMKT